MRQITQTIYNFNELSDESKQTAISELSDINVGYDWWDYEIGYLKETLENIGFENPEINLSGFHCQGNSASFTANVNNEKLLNSMIYCSNYYDDAKGYHKLIKLSDLFSIKVYRSGSHYSHENTCSITWDSSMHGNICNDLLNSAIDDIETLRKDLCCFIYNNLETQYEYLTSDDAIIETIIANEYEFTGDGKLYY